MPETSSSWPIATPYRGSPVPLESTLEAEFSTAQLRELAKWLEVKLKGTSKSGYIEQVAEALKTRSEGVDGPHSDGHHQNSEAILAGLSDEQADFMRRMLTARDADAPLPRSVAMTAWAKQFGPEAPRKLAEVIENLRRRALLFPTITYFTNSFRDVYYQWLPLGKNTPVLKWRVPSEWATSDEGRASDSLVTRHSSLLDSFETFLNAVIQSGLALRSALKPHPKTRQTYWLQGWEHDADEAERVLNSRPNWVPDPTTGLSVPMLSPFSAEGANLIETQTGLSLPQCELFVAIGCALQLISQPDKEGRAGANMQIIEEWFGLSPEDKLGRAWLAWSEQMMAGVELRNAMSSVRASETFQVMRAIGARSLTPGQLAAEWCSLRRYVVRVLRGLPVGAWVDWETLRAQLFAFYPDCAWTTAGRSEWWFATGGGRIKTDPLQAPDWNGTIGVILECILRDALAWFGAVEVTVSESNRLQAFRITEIGEWLIGSRTSALPESAKPKQRAAESIKWLDEHTLRLPPAPERAEFTSFVRQVAERGTEAFTFAFTAASIEGALAQGIGADEVAQQFKKAKLTLSKPVSAQFKLIAKRYGRVRVYDALTVLELADDLALRELSANTSLAQHIVYQLSPRAVVLKEGAAEQLIEEMQERGYTPRVK